MSGLYRSLNSAIPCEHCGKSSPLISRNLGLCPDCLRSSSPSLQPIISEAHRRARQPFHLPLEPPKYEGGAACKLCHNECYIAPGEHGYCGLRYNENSRLAGAGTDKGNVSCYYDPLPTNCVANWVCPGGSGAGYPQFSHSKGPDFGYKNLAVFYQACSFDCLFCQNWHYRQFALSQEWVSAAKLAEQVDEHTSCICYFGGDPSPQLPHALQVSRLAMERQKSNILRICWETNGSMHPDQLLQAAELSLISGGCIKFDLKAYNESLHLALCGVSNRRTLENFRLLAQYAEKRPSPPFLVASTLLIPGYINKQEISDIATFIASLNPDIPYALLGFHPQFQMQDLPPTSRSHALASLVASRDAGLKNVRVGNLHLLGEDY